MEKVGRRLSRCRCLSRFSALTPSTPMKRAVFGALLLLLVLCIAHLLTGRTPWDSKIQTKLANGELRWREYVVIGLWWASLGNALLLALLLGTWRWWTRSLPQPVVEIPSRPLPRHFWPAILMACGLLTFNAWPRLSHSLWGDEEQMLKTSVMGNYQIQKDGTATFKPVGLAENLWLYTWPTNHILYTLVAHTSIRTLSHGESPDGFRIQEWTYRLPALVAALLTLPAIALLAWRMGFLNAGIIAAFLLAVHPWFIRYASEARGYAFAMLLGTVQSLALLAAVRTGKWRAWITFAAAQFGMLYAYPGSLPLAIALNAAALLTVLLQRESSATIQLSRWFVASLASFMLLGQLMAPCIPQLARYLARDRARGHLDSAWLLDFWGYLTSGMPWKPWSSSNPLSIAVEQIHTFSPLLYWSVCLIFPLLLLLGTIACLRADISTRILAMALLLAPALGLLQAKLSGNLLYVWYLIYALPGFILLLSIGVDWITSRLFRTCGCLSLLAIIPFVALTARQTHALRSHPLEPQRESVLLCRPSLDPNDPRNRDILTAQFIFTTPLYDPLAVDIGREGDDPALLQALMTESDKTGKPLFVNFGSRGWARFSFSKLVSVIEDPTKFERVTELPGMDAQLSRLVYRYKK